MVLPVLLLAIVVISTFIYLNGKYNEIYWRRRGVKIYSKNKVLGPIWEFITSKRPLLLIFKDIYEQYPDEPAVGIGILMSPAIYVKDVQNVKYVMKSLNFTDRGFDYIENDLLANNILFMSGVRWKLMRQKLSPLFTPTKLRNMFYIMDKSSRDFVEYLNKNCEKLKCNTFDTLTTFCCAAVGNTVFGIGNESTFNSPFLHVARQAFAPNFFNDMKFYILNIFPTLFKLLKIRHFKKFESFFIGAMKQVFRQRKLEGVKKNDFIDICLEIQKGGAIKNEDKSFQMQPTDELLAAQGFFFYVAGVEPTATALFATMIQLGKHLNIQRRVQEEVDLVFQKCNGQLTYDTINVMEYMDQVLSESMRIFPSVGYLVKRCTKDDVLPVGNIRIAKGTKVFTPIYEYHHDPQYFKDPTVFDPDRFLNEKQNLGVPYQPFGYGLRACIGMRYARLQIKSALANILRNFDLHTVTGEGGIKFRKDQTLLRLMNVDVEYTPRKSKC